MKKATEVVAAEAQHTIPPRFAAGFVPLFNGAEEPALVELRQRQFTASWAAIDARIQVRARTFTTVIIHHGPFD